MTHSTGDPLLGRTIGQYEIASRLGGGAMGVVYKARDLKLGRDVALKFLPQQWSHDAGARERFVREAQAASATNHPNICTVHDIVTADDGQLFIVMGYYEGPTLKERLASGPLPVDEALEIATQAADGLARAHAQGIVHRDIKPGNLILTEDGVRIVDFGLATFVDALQLTAQGSPLGTAAYMSPEQTRGEEVDARADLWALGVVLYEMLTGHVPFRGAYAEAVAYAIRHDAPPPIRAERPEVPEDVEQLVFRALHKDPAVRFASARDMARALRHVRGVTVPQELRTVPLDVHGPQAAYAAAARLRRRRWLGAAAAVLVAAALTITWLLYPVTRTAVVVAPVANDTGYTVLDPYRMALTEELVSRLTDEPGARIVPYERLLEIVRPFRPDAELRESGPVLLEAIAAHAEASTLIVPALVREGSAWKARAEIRDAATGQVRATVETGVVTSALPKDAAYELTVRLATLLEAHLLDAAPLRVAVREWMRKLTGEAGGTRPRFDTLDAADAFERGIDAYERMEYAAARDAFAEAAERAPRNPLPPAWRSRVSALLRQDRDADQNADRAAALDASLLPESDALLVAAAVAERRDLQQAAALYEEIADRYADEPRWLVELAAVEDRLGRVREAELAYTRALELDARLPRPHLELCRLYSPSRLNMPEAARQHGEAAFSSYRQLGNRGGEAQARWCLTDVLRTGTAAERRQAREHAEAALEIMQAPGYPYGLSRAYNYLGIVALLAERNGREAIEHFERALAGAREVGNRFLEPRLLMNLGVSYELVGQRVRALSHYRESFALFEELGNQQEAAWNQANGAAILIDYGGDVDRGIRDAMNARSVFESIGDKYFEVFARRMIASHHRHAGRASEAAEELAVALDIARERDLGERIVQVLLDQGRLQFDAADYPGAAALLLEALKNASGTDRVHARIELARVYSRLGRLDDAARLLDDVAAEIDAIRDDGSRPLLEMARGELALESGAMPAAFDAFSRSAAFWVDELPEAPSVLARAWAGFLEAERGLARGRAAVAQSLEHARTMRRVALEARCLLLLARIELSARRVDAALQSLDAIPAAALAALPELRLEAAYWRSRALSQRGDAAAERAAAEARLALDELRSRVPERDRPAWLARPLIAAAAAM